MCEQINPCSGSVTWVAELLRYSCQRHRLDMTGAQRNTFLQLAWATVWRWYTHMIDSVHVHLLLGSHLHPPCSTRLSNTKDGNFLNYNSYDTATAKDLKHLGRPLPSSATWHRTILRSSSRSVRLALPWCLRIGPTSCFHWDSKPPRGTFWAGRSSFRRPWHGKLLRSSSRSVRLALPWCFPIGPTSCFYWASKPPRGTFWAGRGVQTGRGSFTLHSTKDLVAHGWKLPICSLHRWSLRGWQSYMGGSGVG